MEHLSPGGGSFEESLFSKVVPSESAEAVMALTDPGLSRTDPIVEEFMVQSISEILDDPAVQADLSKRVAAVTGGSARAHSHGPGHSCTKFHVNRPDLLEMATAIVEQASATFASVLSRGQKDGPSLDASTSGFLRRRIFTESIIREIVKREHAAHMKKLENQSHEGAFFAFPNPELMDRLHALSAAHMQSVMNEGFVVVGNFFGDPETFKSMYLELVRLDALALLRPAGDDSFVYWASGDALKGSEFTSKLCENLSLLPFELNVKNKSLLLQVVQQYQVSKLLRESRVVFSNPSQKIACFFPLSERKSLRAKVVFSDGHSETLRIHPGDLVILNTRRVTSYEYNDTDRVFQVGVFLTGPKE